MKTKTISIHLDGNEDGPETEITLHSARIEDGLYRGELVGEAVNNFKEDDESNHAKRSVGIMMRPSCLAALAKDDPLRKMNIDDFMVISDYDANNWLEAVYELNPHWNPSRFNLGNKEAEKKR